MYYDLKTKKYIDEKKSKALGFLYHNILGRCILKVATTHGVAKVYAKYMNSRLSKHKIKKFIIKNNIDLDEYENKQYTSFNDFFMRKIKEGKRWINCCL